MEIIGHQKQWYYLTKLKDEDKLPHAFLFCGQEKLGKKTLAIEFIKTLFGEDINKKPHPDFIFVEPERKEIQIFQIRECLWKLSLKPIAAPSKIALIDQAHFLNVEAQNAILKTLEEPKGKAHIFLISEYPEKLFPTIISRCQILKFYPVQRIEIEKYLKDQKIFNNQTEELIEIAAGRPGIIIDFIKNEKLFKEQKKIINDFNIVLKSDIFTRFEYVHNLTKNHKNLKYVFDVLLRYFRKLLLTEIKNSKENYFSEKIKKLKKIINRIEETEFLISYTNVNPVLALEVLIMEL